MPRAKLKDLTLKQRTFAEQYVRTNGNGTKAAKLAGYSEKCPAEIAYENIRKPQIIAAIDKLTRKHEVSADRVLTRLDNLSIKAEEANDYSTAVKAESLLGKSLGMWVERSINVNVDLSGEHLRALQERMEKRRTEREGSV